ncbi:hypothetical protein LINPERPRIM_LOCUS30611 [Linum perenne]
MMVDNLTLQLQRLQDEKKELESTLEHVIEDSSTEACCSYIVPSTKTYIVHELKVRAAPKFCGSYERTLNHSMSLATRRTRCSAIASYEHRVIFHTQRPIHIGSSSNVHYTSHG